MSTSLRISSIFSQLNPNASVSTIMRMLFASLCVTGAARVVNVSSHAGPSNTVTTLGPPPLQTAHYEGPTKRHLTVDEPTDEERMNPVDVAGAMVNFFPHELEPIVEAMPAPVKSIVLGSMISIEDYKNVFNSKSHSPLELYTALGLQEMSKREEFHPNNRAFDMKNNLLFFFNWNRLRSYISHFAETDEEVKRTLHSIYLGFCNGNEGEVESLTKALDRANHPKNVAEQLEFLQAETTPKDVLGRMGYQPNVHMLAWRHIRDWIRYFDAYKKVHYDQRIDMVTATGIEESVLIANVLDTDQKAQPGSSREWIQNWLIEDWRDEGCTPAEVYTRLGFQLDVTPNYDGYPFYIWTQYMDFIGQKKEKVSALEKMLPRNTMVKSLSGFKGERKRKMIHDTIIHLRKEKAKMELGKLDTTEVEKYLEELGDKEWNIRKRHLKELR